MKNQNELRALTLWRPWPHAIFYGGKRIENRPWKPWKRIVGQYIALHAGLKYDSKGAAWMREMELYDPPEDEWCPRGCIVGVARVTGYINDDEELYFNRSGDQSSWYMGPYGWVLKDVVAFQEPVKATGKMGLWLVDGALKEAVIKAYEAVLTDA